MSDRLCICGCGENIGNQHGNSRYKKVPELGIDHYRDFHNGQKREIYSMGKKKARPDSKRDQMYRARYEKFMGENEEFLDYLALSIRLYVSEWSNGESISWRLALDNIRARYKYHFPNPIEGYIYDEFKKRHPEMMKYVKERKDESKTVNQIVSGVLESGGNSRMG